MTMFPSACMWNYPTPIDGALRQVKETAFHYIDVEPETLDGQGALETVKNLGLRISCVALDHNLPAGCTLDGRDSAANRKGVDHLKKALQKSRDLGASTAYVGSCSNRKQLQAFGEAVKDLAADAAGKEIRLCIEHVPGRALGTFRETLDFVQKAGHQNLFVLLDVGHMLLSKENTAEAVKAAGDRIGYVQMNDNDGKKDRHWALCDGLLTELELKKTIEALDGAGYLGTLGLELKISFSSLISALSKNRNLLLRLQEAGPVKSLLEPEARRK